MVTALLGNVIVENNIGSTKVKIHDDSYRIMSNEEIRIRVTTIGNICWGIIKTEQKKIIESYT